MNRNVFATGAVCLQLLASSVAWAQPKLPFSPTDQEILMLPEECKIKLKGGPPPANAQHLAGVWIDLHHYCFGLNFMNRASFTINKTDKRFNLQSAIQEFDYVLKHAPPNSSVLQPIKARRDMAEQMLKLP